MGFWEGIVIIVAIVVIGRVMSGGRWNKDTRRWEKYSPENPYVRAQGLAGDSSDAPQLRKEIAALKERVATLEKLAVDPGRQLADEIEQLRTLPRTPAGKGDRPLI